MNEHKTPFSRTLSAFTHRRILEVIETQGRALPCSVAAVSGAIVTVNFEVLGVPLPQTTMPLFGPEYVRYPIQVGDLGVTFPVDSSIGLMSGLGSDPANLTLQANLSTLVFFPIGNKNWMAVDPNAVTVYGPNGVVLQDTEGETTATLSPGGGVQIEGTLTVSQGASGTFTTSEGQVVTVQDGIITNIF